MTRFKMVNGEKFQFTTEEEKERDLEEKAWNDAAPERRMADLREQRNILLAETDWIVIKARENNATVPSAWKTYRQELRDLTKQTPTDDALSNIKFPEKPTE